VASAANGPATRTVFDKAFIPEDGVIAPDCGAFYIAPPESRACDLTAGHCRENGRLARPIAFGMPA